MPTSAKVPGCQCKKPPRKAPLPRHVIVRVQDRWGHRVPAVPLELIDNTAADSCLASNGQDSGTFSCDKSVLATTSTGVQGVGVLALPPCKKKDDVCVCDLRVRVLNLDSARLGEGDQEHLPLDVKVPCEERTPILTVRYAKRRFTVDLDPSSVVHTNPPDALQRVTSVLANSVGGRVLRDPATGEVLIETENGVVRLPPDTTVTPSAEGTVVTHNGNTVRLTSTGEVQGDVAELLANGSGGGQ